MDLQQKLREQKDLYLRNKKDVRFLKEAIWNLVYDYYQKDNNREDAEWIIDSLNEELEKKISTQDKNERIGALVSYIVSHGADVLSTIHAVSKWLPASETTVRDGYYKIRNIYGIDPKTDPVMECRDFRLKYGRIPLEYVHELYEAGRTFPGDTPSDYEDHKRVIEAMTAACEAAREFDQRCYDNEMALLKMILGEDNEVFTTQKLSA